jgi:cardiolipin synthase
MIASEHNGGPVGGTAGSSGPRLDLLVDSGEFMDRLRADLAEASESVVVQAMTFEGDLAGRSLANALIRCPAGDRRLIVDAFSRYVMSCRLAIGPLHRFDRALRNELHATHMTASALERAGVMVRYINPAGRMLRGLVARNHKKVVVIDGRIAFVGGLNFSDHNFSWHDLMLRIEDPRAAAFLAGDVEATWAGRTGAAGWGRFGSIAVGLVGGTGNPRVFEPVMDSIAAARDEILVQSPYLSFPFTDRLRDAVGRGVRVTVLAPHPHPLRRFGRYLQWECERSGFLLRGLPCMTHLKAILIDRRRLIVGSSNFDYLSWRRLHEILAIVDEPAVIADFLERVWRADVARSRPLETARNHQGMLERLRSRAGAALTAALSMG